MASSYSKFIEDLRNTPIEIDPWQYSQVGKRNEGPYKQGYQSIKMCNDDTEEPLVDVSRYGLASCDIHLDEYFCGLEAYREAVIHRVLFSRAFLRRSHTRRMAKVDAILRQNGLFLYIVSGWRHPSVQEISKSLYAIQFGEVRAGQLFASVGQDIAPPPHSTGAVADLALMELFSERVVPMFVSINGEQIFSLYHLEDMASNDPSYKMNLDFVECLKNRRVLYHMLCTLGVVFDDKKDLFTAHPGEFWHYGDGDPLSAYLKREPCAKYGRIQLNNDAKSLPKDLSPPDSYSFY